MILPKKKPQSLAADMFKTAYCEEWSPGYKELYKPMTEEQARLCHENRQWYTAVLGGEKPFAAIELRKNFIAVMFFDDLLRITTVYHFYERDDKKLFLEDAFVREYEGDIDKIIKTTSYRFSRDGELYTYINDKIKKEALESTGKIDVTRNYETWPVFKDYWSLLQLER